MSDNPHKFWNKQPVGVEEGANSLISHPNKIPTEEYKLPEGCVFENIIDYKELSKFLSENYVEDIDNEFRLIYSESFFSWFINNPKHCPEYSLGLKFNNCLIGYIFGKETAISINGLTQKVAAINFLCVIKSKRNRRISPILIKEITRRFNCNGIYSGIFTAGTPLFFKISTAKYWHKPINTKKLITSGFLDRPVDVSLPCARSSTRLLKEEDIMICYKLYKNDIQKYKLVDDMDEDDFRHFINNKIMRVYVNEVDGVINSFGTYFVLDTMSIKKNQMISSAYLNLICGDCVKTMIEDLIYFSAQEKCDVFNSINIGEAGKYLEELDFLEGSGELNYYLYNWKSGVIDKNRIFYYMH